MSSSTIGMDKSSCGDQHTQAVIHILALPTLAWAPPEAIWRWRADLVPQGDLPGVPAGDAGGEQPLHVAQEHHSVHPVVLTAGLLQRKSGVWEE